MPRTAPANTAQPMWRAPTLPWPRVAGLAIVLALTSLSGVEAFWRSRGFKPEVPDSVELWRYRRSQVVGHDPHLIVAIGTSRVRAGLCPAAFGKLLPNYRFVQLGVTGAVSPIGVLAEIAKVPGFSGIVLCDVLPPLLDKRRWDDQALYYDGTPAYDPRWNSLLYWELREHFLITSSDFSIRECLHAALMAPHGYPHFIRNHIDRSLTMDVLPDDVLKEIGRARFREYGGSYRDERRNKTLQEFAEGLAPLTEVADQIHRNHGQIVFLRLPTSGTWLEVEEATLPSTQYFAVASRTTKIPWIDFRELPGNDRFDCPDGSHLSAQGAYAFTKSLIHELCRRQLLPRHQPKAD